MKKKPLVPEVADEAKAQPVEIHQHESKPEPVLNRGPEGWVKVRAVVHLGEADRTGSVRHRNPGDVFELTEQRARAMAGLVTRE